MSMSAVTAGTITVKASSALLMMGKKIVAAHKTHSGNKKAGEGEFARDDHFHQATKDVADLFADRITKEKFFGTILSKVKANLYIPEAIRVPNLAHYVLVATQRGHLIPIVKSMVFDGDYEFSKNVDYKNCIQLLKQHKIAGIDPHEALDCILALCAMRLWAQLKISDQILLNAIQTAIQPSIEVLESINEKLDPLLKESLLKNRVFFTRLNKISENSKQHFTKLPLPKNPLPLLVGSPEKELDTSDIIACSLERNIKFPVEKNHIEIIGEGGHGKSTLAKKLYEEGHAIGLIPIYFSFGSNRDKFKKNTQNNDVFEALFDVPIDDPSKWPEDTAKIILIVDGVNELGDHSVASRWMSVFSKWSAYTNIQVIFLSRSSLPSDCTCNKREVFEMMPPTDADLSNFLNIAISDLTKSQLTLLKIPFFANRFLRLKENDPEAIIKLKGKAKILVDYFKLIISNAECNFHECDENALIDNLSKFAFNAYGKHSGIEFPADEFISDLVAQSEGRISVNGAGIIQDAFETAGLLKKTYTELSFGHQLYHDFLVGFYLANNVSGLDYKMLDNATWKQDNIVPISFAAELVALNTIKNSDLFLKKIYDYHYPATTKAIIEFGSTEDWESSPLVNTICAVIGIKAFDLFEKTASDARIDIDVFAEKGIATPVSEIVKKVASIRDFTANLSENTALIIESEFRELITSMQSEPLDLEGALAKICREDPILGWATVNCYRLSFELYGEPNSEFWDAVIWQYKSLLEEEQSSKHQIGGVSDSHLTPQRRRILFLLGMANSEGVIKFLIRVCFSHAYATLENLAAQGDALRSLIEIASRRPSQRKTILEFLQHQVTFNYDHPLMERLRKSIMVVPDRIRDYETLYPLLSDIVENAITYTKDTQHRMLWEIQQRSLTKGGSNGK